jgi:hypothetical protein
MKIGNRVEVASVAQRSWTRWIGTAEGGRGFTRLRQHARRLGAAFDAGASPRQIAKKALISHAQVRRIVGAREQASPAAYTVTLERRGVAPLSIDLVVRAGSERDAAELASWIAERKRGGFFEATAVRRAPRNAVTDYDDADL